MSGLDAIKAVFEAAFVALLPKHGTPARKSKRARRRSKPMSAEAIAERRERKLDGLPLRAKPARGTMARAVWNKRGA